VSELKVLETSHVPVVSVYFAMKFSSAIFLVSTYLVCMQGCSRNSDRPASVPFSAVWVREVLIQCSIETAAGANRCTVYKGTTGDVLESGFFVLSGAGREANSADLQYAAFDGTRIYLADARYLYPVLLENYPVPFMEDRLRLLAGDEAINCGRVGRYRNARAASDCAIEAFAVYYSPRGIDSIRSTGLASNARGGVYAVDYNSRPWSFLGLPKEVQLTDGNHILVVSCPKPVRLIRQQDGTLDCMPPLLKLDSNLRPPFTGSH